MARPFEWENRNALLVQTGANEVRTRPVGVPKWIRDATPDDVDKEFVVPSGKIWDLQAILLTIVTTETAGNRVLVFTVLDDAGNSLLDMPENANITANMTGRCNYSTSGTRTSSAIAGRDIIPTMKLLPGYKLRIWDDNEVDVNDVLSVVLHVIEYDASS